MNETEEFLGVTTRAHGEEQLIAAIAKFGLEITGQDVPEVLRLGADTFLHKHGVTGSEKSTLELYLILNEMREK